MQEIPTLISYAITLTITRQLLLASDNICVFLWQEYCLTHGLYLTAEDSPEAMLVLRSPGWHRAEQTQDEEGPEAGPGSSFVFASRQVLRQKRLKSSVTNLWHPRGPIAGKKHHSEKLERITWTFT